MLRAIKKRIPFHWKRYVKDKIWPPEYAGDRYRCPACGSNVRYFRPIEPEIRAMQEKYGHTVPFEASETFNHENYYCPGCNVRDRERLFALFLKQELAKVPRRRKLRMVEFAPNFNLDELIRRYPNVEYRTADLARSYVDDLVDLCDMKLYADQSFDIFLCSHVLEHVVDDRKAMRELYRILKPGGWGIAMVPILLHLTETYEDPTKTTEEERWKHFGQGDHVRMYEKRDYVKRLGEAGFEVESLGADYFGADVFDRAGISPGSVLYVVRRPR